MYAPQRVSMAEKEQQNVTASEPPGITAIRDVVDAHAGKLPEHGQGGNRKRSGGEVLFDRVVYTGIGFGVNEAASLWITDQFMHGKPKWYLGGKPFSKEGFDSAAGWIAKKFKMPKAKAGNTLLMATLLSGGTLLVLPMRWLEENKISWVQRANHMLDGWRGNKMSAEEVTARDEEVERAIACSPQQNWTSLLVGRVAAMFSSWATGTFLIGPDNNKKIMNWSEKTLTSGAKAVGLEKMAKTDTFKRYAQLTGVETYSCAISSVVLEIASKLFAKRGTEVHDPEICKKYEERDKAAAAAAAAANAAPAGDAEGTDNRRLDPEKYKRPCPKQVLAARACPTKTYAGQVKAEKDMSESAAPTLAV